MSPKKPNPNKRFYQRKENAQQNTKKVVPATKSQPEKNYRYWNKYFSDIDEGIPGNFEEIIIKIQILIEHTLNYQLDQIKLNKILIIDFQKFDISKFNLLEEFMIHPEIVIRGASMVAHETLTLSRDLLDIDFKIQTMLVNFPIFTTINNIKSFSLGKLVSTSGVVSMVEKVKVVPTQMSFYCTKCAMKQIWVFKNDLFSYPHKCSSEMCNSKKFEPDFYDTNCIEYQKIIIYDQGSEDDSKREKSPGSIVCLLKSDLVDKCSPGDEVTLVGIVKNYQVFNDCQVNTKIYFTLFINVNSLCLSHKTKLLLKNSNSISNEEQENTIYITEEIKSHPDLFLAIVSSFSKTIYGNYLLKAALILCLLSGTSITENSFRRKNAHLLMLGEPGLGKSQLLKALYSVAPKAVYICGTASSSAGLTISLIKDGGSNDFSIEPGAVVLANHGICCIDEFDKIPQHHDSLLEVMEQQCVSIAKSGTRCNMQAQTSIIAAANFNQGSYSKTKTLKDNICFNHNLLSRFDLIFLLFDQNNSKYDKRLADHVLNMRMNKSFHTQPQYFSKSSTNLECNLDNFIKNLPLSLSINQIKNIVAYSRENIHPVLNKKAKNLIKEYYVSIRKSQQNVLSSIPPTVRQLESLIRLTEARARADLRDEATDDDVRDVIDIIQKSFADLKVALDSSKKTSAGSQKVSKKTQIEDFVGALGKIALSKGDTLFTLEELKNVASGVLFNIDFEEAIVKLNDQCILLKKGSEKYKFVG